MCKYIMIVKMYNSKPSALNESLNIFRSVSEEKNTVLVARFTVILLHFFPEVSQHLIHSLLFPAEMRLQQMLLFLASQS